MHIDYICVVNSAALVNIIVLIFFLVELLKYLIVV